MVLTLLLLPPPPLLLRVVVVATLRVRLEDLGSTNGHCRLSTRRF
jgi:hypothetical protein